MALNLHDEKKKWLDWAIEIQSLAQAGMTYGHDVYDMERYERLWKFQQKCYLTKQIFQ